jgi:hypothetical protein
LPDGQKLRLAEPPSLVSKLTTCLTTRLSTKQPELNQPEMRSLLILPESARRPVTRDAMP